LPPASTKVDVIRMDVLREPSDRIGLLREVPAECGGSVVKGSEHPAHIIDPYDGGATGTGVIDEQLLGFRGDSLQRPDMHQ